MPIMFLCHLTQPRMRSLAQRQLTVYGGTCNSYLNSIYKEPAPLGAGFFMPQIMEQNSRLFDLRNGNLYPSVGIIFAS